MKKCISLLVLLCMAIAMLPVAAFAEEPLDSTFTKDGSGNYLITSEADWNALAELVKNGTDCAGAAFKLTNDISVSRSVGEQTGSGAASRKRFAGSFDGDHHTLTVDLYTTDAQYAKNHNYCAPFAYTKAVTISNLTVTGTIHTDAKFAAGVVGSIEAANAATETSAITNVHVSVTFDSTTHGDATDGGLVGILETNNTLSFTDCWFDGSFLGENTVNCGGFVGYNKGTINYTNVLFNPTAITFNTASPSDLSETFARAASSSSVNNFIENCYYTKKLGAPNEAAKRVYAQKFDEDDNFFDEVDAVDGNTYYIHLFNMKWSDIQDTLADANEDSCIVANDILAGENNTAIVCDREFTIDLNDCFLDRALADAEGTADGYVIKVENGGVLTLKNGTIKGGHVTGNGGGIYVAAGGTLNLENVRITENKADVAGGGIYLKTGATLNVKGNVNITNNSRNNKNKTEKNLYLASGTLVTLAGALSSSSRIGVAKAGNVGVITDNLPGNGIAKNFVVDNSASGYVVRINNVTGEAELRIPYTVTVSDGIENGAVVSDKKTATETETVTLTVTPEEGYELKSLVVLQGENEITVENGQFTMPAGNVTVSAEFKRVLGVGVYDGVVSGENGNKKTVAVIGILNGLDEADSVNYDRVEMSVDFYQNGSVIKSISDSIRSICTTVRDVASVNEVTAATQGTLYVEDADYIFAMRMTGIPAGDYTAVVTVSLIGTNSATACTATREINFTVS